MAIFIKGNGAAAGGGGTVDTVQAGTGISVDATDPANPIVSSTVTDTNDAAKVSSNDTTAGYLNGKLVAGSNITFTEGNDGGNETLTITSADTNDAVKVSSNDTTPGDLEAKLVAGTNITLTTNNDGSNETLTIAASGGVTGFTGSQNTASPNNTVNASRLLVDATSTNADAVLQPKGTGALLAQLPDGAVSGGNKRGVRAVDLQTLRNNAAQVASGERSIVIGANSTASGLGSIAIGIGSTAAGIYSLALSESARTTQRGEIAIGAGGPTSTNDTTQYQMMLLSTDTTNDVQKELCAAGIYNVADNTNRILVQTDTVIAFSALISARKKDANNEGAGYKIEGVIDNNGGTVAFVGTPTTTILGEDTAGWDVVAEADDTNNALVFKVTGAAATNIRWLAVVQMARVTYT